MSLTSSPCSYGATGNEPVKVIVAAEHPANALLDAVALKQFVWKSATMQLIGVAVLKAALESPASLWPDEIDLSFVRNLDKNCIGSVFRVLREQRFIEPTAAHRRSTAEAANGRIVWEYRVCHTGRVLALLKRTDPNIISPITYIQTELV